MAESRRGPFSSRLDWDLRPNALSELLRQKRDAGAAVLDLTESNPTRVDLAYAEEEILGALLDPAVLTYEPSPRGLARTRADVAGYYVERGRNIDPEQVVLTASTSEAYSYLFRLLADPGDELLVPRPSYPLFEFLAGLDSVQVVHYPLPYDDGWWLDLDGLRARLTPRSRAVLAVNPNNPTGSFLKKDEWERLVELCAGRDLALVIDEVFSDYAFGPDLRRAPAGGEGGPVLTFTLNGLSKIAGLPQMKLAWIVVEGPPTLREQAIERLELVADTYLSPSAPTQHAAGRWLALQAPFQQRMMSRLRGNLEALRRAAAGSPCQVLDVEGGWYATLRLPRTHREQDWVLAFLREDNVLVQPGFFYDFESEPFAVISLLPPPQIFREGIARLMRRARGW